MHLDYPTIFYRTFFRFDLFSLYVLFSLSDHVMVPQRTVSFRCRLMHVHSSACACIINEKDKKKIPWRTSRGLNRENKTYQLKRFISPGYYRSQEKSKTMVIMQPFCFFFFWGVGDGEDKQGALSGLGEIVNFPFVSLLSYRIPVSKVFKIYLYTNICFNYSSFTLPNVL